MACLYRRGNMLWLSWWILEPASGRRRREQKPLNLSVEDMAKGLIAKKALERELKALKAIGVTPPEFRTVGAYKRNWLESRKADGKDWERDRARLKHAIEFDSLPILEVRPRHVRDTIRRLKREGKLAPRMIRHVYGTLHTMFEDAVVEEVIAANPIKLKRGELPPVEDKDLTWRPTAIYLREEVEQLMSDERIPEDRRVLYGLLFLTGSRVGEIADRRWRDYDASREPLGCLSVVTSFNTQKKISKPPKTRIPRQVPVHPMLAKILAAWKLGGWQRKVGRAPGPDDIMVPTVSAKRPGLDGQRRSAKVLRQLHADLEVLGFRPRRTHDTRRTLISLAMADGARADILKWITHGPPKSVMGLYTTLPWATLCQEMGKLKITQRGTAKATKLRGVEAGAANEIATLELQSPKKASNNAK